MNEILQEYAAAIVALLVGQAMWFINPSVLKPAAVAVIYLVMVIVYQWAVATYGQNISPSAILAVQGAVLALLPLMKMIEPRWQKYNSNDNVFKMASELKDWQKALLIVMLLGGLPWALFSVSTLVVYIFSLVAFAFFTHYMHQLDQVIKKKAGNA